MFILYILSTLLLAQYTWAYRKLTLLDKLNRFDSGILVVQNQQTSCQLIVINEAYGFISANCIASSLENMRVAIRGPSSTDLFKLNGITNHPKYNPTTLANNIAVAHFDFNRDTKYDGQQVTASCQNLDQLAFVRRLLTKVNDTAAEWDNTPLTLETKDNPSQQCSLGSPVFAANRKNFICSDKAVSVDSIKKDCPLPYGLVYGEVKDSVGPAALYSHTVVFGQGLCSNYAKLHYYTYIEDYLAWGESITGFKSKLLAVDSQTSANATKDFAMKCQEQQVPGVKVYGGDLYKQLNTPAGGSPPPPPPPPPPSKTTSTCTTTSTIYLPKPTGSSTYIPNIVIVGTDGKTTSTPTDSGANPGGNNSSGNGSSSPGSDNTSGNSNSPTNISVVGSDGSTTPTNSSTDSSTGSSTDSSTPTDSSSTDSSTSTDNSSTSTSPHADAQNKKGGVSSNTSMIIGILVGLGVLILLLVGLWWYRRRKRLAEQEDLANR